MLFITDFQAYIFLDVLTTHSTMEKHLKFLLFIYFTYTLYQWFWLYGFLIPVIF